MPTTKVCCVLGCNGRLTNVSIFNFPNQFERCWKWVKASGNQHLLDLSIQKLHTSKFICEKHFTNDMFMGSNRTQLIRSAVPTVSDCEPLNDLDMELWVQRNSAWQKSSQINIDTGNAISSTSSGQEKQEEGEPQNFSHIFLEHDYPVTSATSMPSTEHEKLTGTLELPPAFEEPPADDDAASSGTSELPPVQEEPLADDDDASSRTSELPPLQEEPLADDDAASSTSTELKTDLDQQQADDVSPSPCTELETDLHQPQADDVSPSPSTELKTDLHQPQADDVSPSASTELKTDLDQQQADDVSPSQSIEHPPEMEESAADDTAPLRNDGDSLLFRVPIQMPGSETDSVLNCKICRLCAALVPLENLTSLFSHDAVEQKLIAKINQLMPGKVREDDKLPHYVCPHCIGRLNDCIATVDSFITADKELRNLYHILEKEPDEFVQSNEPRIPEGSNGSHGEKVAFTNKTAEDYALSLGLPSVEEASRIFEALALGDSSGIMSWIANSIEYMKAFELNDVFMCGRCGEAQLDEKVLQNHTCERLRCIICGVLCVDKNKFEAHLSTHIVDKRFHCKTCDRRFDLETDFKDHICKYCGNHYQNTEELNAHVVDHKEEIQYKCLHCNESFSSAKDLKSHKRVHISICKICFRKFDNPKTFKWHETRHSQNKPIPCHLCGKLLANSKYLRYHMKTVHSLVTRYRDTSLKGHQITLSSSCDFRCDVCGEEFYFKGALELHFLIHSSEVFYTCVCGEVFTRLPSLFVHKRRVHGLRETKGKPKRRVSHFYECEVCGRQFRLERRFKHHMARHRGVKKLFACDICGKGFSSMYACRDHRMVHTGERPFKCSICDKTFRSSSNLKRHSDVHREETPHQCSLCSKYFKRPKTLREHLKRHSGVKPHGCPICGRGFAVKGDMMRHTRIHTKD